MRGTVPIRPGGRARQRLISSRGSWLAASDRDTSPAEAAVLLRDCRDRLTELGIPELPSIAGAYLAGAYARLGRGDEAVQAAALAVDDLPGCRGSAGRGDGPAHLGPAPRGGRRGRSPGGPGVCPVARPRLVGGAAARLVRLPSAPRWRTTTSRPARRRAPSRREDPATGSQSAGPGRVHDAAGRGGRAAAVVAVDVDNLKLLNDSHGHQRGDDVLRAVAGLLVDQSRVEDLVARTGGDEFVVLMDHPGERGALELVDRVRKASAAVAEAAQQPWLAQLRLSIGQASSADGIAIDELLAQADSRMYADKRRRPSA